MTKAVRFTQANLRRALKVAREEGLRVVIQADGITFVKDEIRPQQSTGSGEPDPVEPEREIVL